MPKVIQAAEFFVVGSPVQPDRRCYVERSADRQLEEAIRAKQLCCVLGPRGIGKSSLMHRVARTLRQAGELVAMVDLARIGARNEAGSIDQWAFSVAHRVAHELGLDVDLEPWWREKTAVAGNDRLVDFFWEIVLTNTTAPVTVLLDEITAVMELPFATELFAAIHACYARRTREPDFARLSFVLLGSTTRRMLAGADRSSPLVAARVIEPADFSAEETYRLAMGLGGEQALAQALMDRICVWTGGHPYLTQKVARGVAHKGGKLEDVERVVREQLLAPGIADGEPLLGYTRSWLTASVPQARRVLRRCVSGAAVPAPTDIAVRERLLLSGVVVLDAAGKLRFRNRVFKELVAQWLKPSHWGRRLAGAAAVLVVGAGAYWYTQLLPIADVRTLESATADSAAVAESYGRLQALPGFAERADQLLAAALRRQGAAATTLAEATNIDAQLRRLPGQEAAADELLGAFWLRRANLAAGAEQRDAAILLAQRAAALPMAAEARAALAQLVDDDYRYLERSLRLASAPVHWQISFAQATVWSVDARRQLLRTAFGVGADGALDSAPLPLTALQHSALSRELVVEGDGTAGDFELELALQHPAADDLLVTLAAPSGAQAAVVVPRGSSTATEAFVFHAVRGSALTALTDEGRRGVWRLTVVDRRADNAGRLASWELRFGTDTFSDVPLEPLVIPDPVRTADVIVAVADHFALVRPASLGAIGTVALWDLAAGRLANDFTVPSTPQHVAVNASGDRLLVATEKLLTLWNVADGQPAARLTTDTAFVLPPKFSADGGYLAIAEQVEGAQPLYSVLRAADASLVGSFEGIGDATEWQLGPGARYVALLGPAKIVRVLDGRRGTVLRRLPHASDVQRLLPLPDGAALISVDADGEIQSWSLTATGAPVAQPLGVTRAADSVSLSADGARLAYAARDGAVWVVDVETAALAARLRHGVAPAATTQLGADGTHLVPERGSTLRLWHLPAREPDTLAAARTPTPSAIAIDRHADIVAMGLGSGQLQVARAGDLEAGVASLDYFGHRGAITAVALNAARGLAATGGRDGIVRLWDLVAASPTGAVMQPAAAPIDAVALSADGRLVANATGTTVRVATVADGAVTAEVVVPGIVAALTFAADGTAVAIGDSTGRVTLAPLDSSSREPYGAQLDAAVTALTFAPSGERLVVGDAGGSVRLMRRVDGALADTKRVFPQPIRWLGFNDDASALLLATDDWLHLLAPTTLEPRVSRLAPRRVSGSGLVLEAGANVRLAGLDSHGALGVTDLDLTAGAQDVAPEPDFVARDWPAALGVELGDNGEPVASDR